MTTSEKRTTGEQIEDLVRIASNNEATAEVRRAAFAPLMERHQNMVYGYALGILRDPSLAEDATQEAFIAAWQNLARLREPAAFPGWLRRIVQWQCYRLKRSQRLKTVSLEESEEVVFVQDGTQPHLQAERSELNDFLNRAIAALPESGRLAVLLFYIGGHSHAEIAQFLEVSPGTVKKRIFDARHKLKSYLLRRLSDDMPALAPSHNEQFQGRTMKWIQPDNLTSEYDVFLEGFGPLIWDMLLACAEGDLKKVKSLLKQEPTLAKREFAYFTPLHFAAREGHDKIVKLLLEHGADATYKSGLGWQETPINLARERGQTKIADMMEKHTRTLYSISPAGQEICAAVRDGDRAKVEALLSQNPNLIHEADERGNTPLHWAVMTRRLDMIDSLITHGANTEAVRADGAKPVHVCIHGDYWHRRKICVVQDDAVVLGFLLAKGAVIDTGIAAHIGDIERVRQFIETDPSSASAANSFGKRPLSYAARRGYTEIVKLLLDAGATPNAPERDAVRGLAFYEAVSNNHVESAKLLLEAGADPDAPVESSGNPLMRALSNNNQQLIDLLYSRGSTSEMYYYLSQNRFDVVSEVLKANPNIANSGGDYGFLCMAAGFASVAMVQLVLRYKPDLNRPWYANKYIGYTLGRQTAEGVEILKLFIEAGADLNLANWVGVTYLHKVALSGTLEMAALLIDNGAHLEARDDEFNSTPLGWAARWGNKEMVEFLLNRGAKTSDADFLEWTTPLSWAKLKGHSEITELLEQY